ncbi:MAG: TonB-dependent receptor [Acidiphilium sp.]|nr:TonB-dependent receptor [Acidiphilium sp.]MDD4936266.1 TonB-dependent receptor [Acidiphilium sp.]
MMPTSALTSSLALALVAPSAFSQTVPPPAAADAVSAGQVSATGTLAAPQSYAAQQVNPVQVFKSSQTTKVIGRRQIAAAGAVGGIAKALALAPGVNVSTYGSNGATKSSISIDGVKAGWAGFSGGNTDNGSIGVSFDGVPMVNPGNGLWQATLIPQNSLIQSIGVTYGPGNPLDRWYTNIGGGLNFVPLQPAATPSAEITGTYGSYNTRNLDFSLQTGDYHGWETVFAGGLGSADSFLKAPDGFPNGNNNYAYYFKTRKVFEGGDFSIGGYISRTPAYRPLAIPVSPIAGVSINGFNQPGTPYSEQTTGYYTALPGTVNRKLDRNQIALVYGQLNLDLNTITSLHNLTYFVRESRLHLTPLHDFAPGATSLEETNAPYSWMLGDKAYVELKPRFNDIAFGGYFQISKYSSQEQLWNPSLGFANAPTPTNLLGSPSVPNGSFDSDNFRQKDAAIFLQDAIEPLPSLTITPGIRFVNYGTDFTPNESVYFPLAVQLNPGGVLTQFPAASKTFSRFEPSLGINYRAFPWLALYASYARAYRLPEFGGGTGPFVALPASQLELEQGDDYQAGVKAHWDTIGPARDVQFGANVFHLAFAHETLPTALASGGSLLAFGSSVYNGLNIYADGSPVNSLYVFANAGFTHAFFKDFTNATGSVHGVPISYTPDITFNAGAYYKYFAGTTLIEPRVTYQYVGAQKMYDNSQNITSNQGIAPYGVINLSAKAYVPVSGLGTRLKMLTFNLEVDNVAGLKYNPFEYISAGGLYGAGAGAVLALPAPGRAIYGSVGAKF